MESIWQLRKSLNKGVIGVSSVFFLLRSLSLISRETVGREGWGKGGISTSQIGIF